MTHPPPSSSSSSRPGLAARLALVLALGAGSVYAASFAFMLKFARAMRGLFAGTRTAPASSLLERITGPADVDLVLRTLAIALVWAALVLALGIWRRAAWTRLARVVWMGVATLVGAAVVADFAFPGEGRQGWLMLAAWVSYVIGLGYVVGRAGRQLAGGAGPRENEASSVAAV